MDPECVPCLLRRVIFETELVAPERTLDVMKASLFILDRGFGERVNSARLSTEVHRRVYDLIGSQDPYHGLKLRADQVVSSLVPRAEELIDRSEDRLRTALLCSIAGNVLDFGIGKGFDDPEDLVPAFDSIVAQGLNVDDMPSLRRLLERAESILYLLDNCGEAQFDKLVVREIKRMGVEVKGVVKGAPVLTDVTMEDAERISLLKLFDHTLSTGMFAVGLDLERMDDRLCHEMEDADLILCKGMANFEALSDCDYRPIAFVMRAKCNPVARAVGARKDDNVVRVYERDSD
jgi:damage-control phosphatase, subfamily I